jgi:hypothetical protein
MNTVEEKLWNYIDGSCTPDEHKAITLLIEQDEVYRRKYQELLLLNSEFAAVDLDEPPMAFTYNVMEAIRNEHALSPLKASINTRIIKGIGIFFVFTISAILIFALSQINWSVGALTSAPIKFSLPNVSQYFKGPVMEGFWFFDLVLALYLGDTYLRKKGLAKTGMSVPSGGQENEH